MNYWFPSFLVFFYIIGWLIGMCLSSFLGTPFELSWSHLGFVARPEDPEPLAFLGYLGSVLTTGLPSDFMTLVGWAFFSSSLCFMNSKAYLFMGLGSSLNPLMELGLSYFFLYCGLKSFIFSWSSTLCAILGLGATWWLFLDLNRNHSLKGYGFNYHIHTSLNKKCHFIKRLG